MRYIAIVTEGMGGVYPIPNVNGGAIETWITDLIRQNDSYEDCFFDVYSCYSKEAKKYKFKNTKIYYFRATKLERFFCKCVNYIRHKIGMKTPDLSVFNMKVAHFGKWKKYDYILVENGMSIYEAIIKRKHTQGKMIFHLRNDIEYVKDVPWAERSDVRTRLVGDTAAEVLVISKYLLKRFLDIKPIDHIRVFYNCVDTELYKPFDEKEKIKLRAELGIKKEEVVFLYSGRVMPEKGALELVNAFVNVYKRSPLYKFLK